MGLNTFHEELLDRARPVWNAILSHPFLMATAEGRIPHEAFATWLQQDYLYVAQAIRFFSVLAAKAPASLSAGLAASTNALGSELRLFESMAADKGISLHDLCMTPTCHAYTQFMLATAYGASFEEGFTLLYGAEKAYFDSWTFVRRNLTAASPWQAFIDKWSGDSFRRWIEWLELALDNLAAAASPSLREKMAAIFLLTGQYELLFWNMALRGERWPV